jgi:hypothetical protein
MALASGTKLASPEQIRAQRNKLEDTMVGIQKMLCPLDAQATESL